MRRIFLSILLLVSFVSAQEFPLFFKAYSPEFIPANKEFEVSLVMRLPEYDFETFDFYILTDRSIDLLSILYQDSSLTENINFYNSQMDGYIGQVYKAQFEDIDSIRIRQNSFQVLMKILPENIDETQINFVLRLINSDGSVLEYNTTSAIKSADQISPVDIYFFHPQELGGNALYLKDDSKINLTFNPESERQVKNPLVEFWIKFDTLGSSFFNVIQKEISDTLITLAGNRYQMLFIPQARDEIIFKDHFLSVNSWNHFMIKFDNSSQSAGIFMNSEKVMVLSLNTLIDARNLAITFSSDEAAKYEIDLLKIWDASNSPKMFLQNKHYLNYNADSSRLIANYTFDNMEEKSEDQKTELNFNLERTLIDYSSAPIFSRVPELDVKVYSTFYSIEWFNNDILLADSYVLEKSYDGSTYTPIFETESEDDPEKIYYFSDEKSLEEESVFYRIKQLNKDGSMVYSPSIQIGETGKEIFSLEQNYPNPFNPKTTINLEIFEADDFEITVYDLVGKKLVILHSGMLSQGVYSFTFDGTKYPSGIYFYEVKTPSGSIVRKMILAK
ncbi:MAG: T9SS type A sorting domain-containing protein [Melioribacteraceae bacterium]|nr:T9SS type A sorting domain-containing protein [Melioribacteraceae bacterium]MCF8356293.1 T9SS type A sorting domain-containing protein [Melioribacteraceae bacterium]MCF8393550.1 T9SS type A sorting domain-containing protein [Melioribacteraceae bacterium]MCF8419360.1 T9SS type A sorting domain-containing protein [Melioribacteraceae bacterium]